MKQNLLLAFLGLSSSLMLIALPVGAESIPSCRNIRSPRPGSVCYKDYPFSARQRDVGGTRTHEFLVERVAPNWVIIDWDVIREGGFGAVSEPQGSIVSASGHASILSTTRRNIEQLRETRSELQGKAQGCYPPVCGELKGKINTVNQDINRLSEYEEWVVQAGGNEKIVFSYTTSVKCNTFYCGGGASIHGIVRVYHRYLGNPNSIIRRSESQSNYGWD